MAERTNILTRWRRALVDHLRENLPDDGEAWAFTPEERDGPAKRKLVSVFVPSISEWSSDVNFATPPLIIRAWLPRARQPRTTAAHDPAPLEQLAVDLLACLEPVQASLLTVEPLIYFRVTGVEFDKEDWGVQATLTSWTRNPATVA